MEAWGKDGVDDHQVAYSAALMRRDTRRKAPVPNFKGLPAELEAIANLRNYHQWILDEIRPFLGTYLAEIGGGIGTFADLLASDLLATSHTVSLTVFEPVAHLYQRMSENLATKHPHLMKAGRLSLTQGYFGSRTGEFDTVIMINVLEHIENDLEMVRTVYHSLSPGGILVLFVPALPWLYSALDKVAGHHRRYEKTLLENLCAAAGFEVIHSKYMDCFGVLPWYLIQVVWGSQSVSPGLTRVYDRWAVPLTRRLESLHPPYVGKNILVVSKK